MVPFYTSASGLGLAGFTAVPGAISGSDEVPSLAHPFTFGTPFDWQLGLFTYGYGQDGSGESDWHVELTGIEVLGPAGETVTDFSVASASGSVYGASGVVHPPCAYGLDDDGDGLVDAGVDPGCFDASAASIENPKCQNGADDDGDGGFDFDGGAAANAGVPLGPPDSYCTMAHRNRERPPSSCGLGGELLLLVAAWRRLRRTRSGARLD